MKTTITKQTIKTIMAQARSLGAIEKKDSARFITCEVESPDGKRRFSSLPVKLLEWLADFDSPPAMEIATRKKLFRELRHIGGKARYVYTTRAVFEVNATLTDGKRTSRVSCGVDRIKTAPAVAVFIRIDAQGVVSCIERVAKLKRVECAHGKRFIRAGVLAESHGGKWLLAKARKGVFSVLFQPEGMIGCAVALNVVNADTEAEAITEANRLVTDQVKERVMREQFAKACELAEKAEREAREEMGEEVGEIAKPALPVATPGEEITEAPPVAEPAKVAPVAPAIESVTVSAPTRSEGITEEKGDTGTLTFPSLDMAKAFAVLWGRATHSGHTVSARRADGSATVTIYNVTAEKRCIVDLLIARLGAMKAPVSTPATPQESPAPISSPLPAELQPENEGKQPAMAYSKPMQTPPATVTPSNPPAPPVKPANLKAKPIKRDIAPPRQRHSAPYPWRYEPCQRNRPPHARNLGNLARLPSARQTAPPALMFSAPVLSASPPFMGITRRFHPYAFTHTPRPGELRQ